MYICVSISIFSWRSVFKKILFIFRERGKEGAERKRNIDVREKHQLVASPMCPNWGLNLLPRHMPRPGIYLATTRDLLLLCGVMPNQDTLVWAGGALF